jgi:hypothetical protein
LLDSPSPSFSFIPFLPSLRTVSTVSLPNFHTWIQSTSTSFTHSSCLPSLPSTNHQTRSVLPDYTSFFKKWSLYREFPCDISLYLFVLYTKLFILFHYSPFSLISYSSSCSDFSRFECSVFIFGYFCKIKKNHA